MPPSLPLALTATTTTAAAVLVGTVGLLACASYVRRLPLSHGCCCRREPAAAASPGDDIYPLDALPGGRSVETPYGTLRVYEWGGGDDDQEEEGEREDGKVLFLQGIGTPSVGYGDMLGEFARRGYRVLTFDYYGRGHSSSPKDRPHDTALYDYQVLCALASSPRAWRSFHLVGYSLGGGLGAAFAVLHPGMLRSLTVVAPGGLVRSGGLTRADRVLYAAGAVPGWLGRWWMGRRLDPGAEGRGGVVEYQDQAEEEEEEEEGGEEGRERVMGIKGLPKWDDLVRWQMRTNPGFVEAYLSTFQHAPIYDQHDTVWARLGDLLRERRGRKTSGSDNRRTNSIRREDRGGLRGLDSGRITAFLGTEDVYVPCRQWTEDAERVLGSDAVDVHLLPGGHEIGIQDGRRIATLAIASWHKH